MKKPTPFVIIFLASSLGFILLVSGCLKDQTARPGCGYCAFRQAVSTPSSQLLFSYTRDTCLTDKALNGLYVVKDNLCKRIRCDYGAFDSPANPRWSPDGSKIAYNPGMRCDKHALGDSILIIRADGSFFSKPVSGCGPSGCLFPVWSPNNERIAYCHCKENTFSIRTIGLHGGNEKVIARFGGKPHALDWSPDGSRFICVSNEGTFLVATDGSGLDRFSTLENFAGHPGSPRWSKDGSRIVFTRDHWSAIPPIYVINPDGTGLREMAYGMYPDWTGNGKYLVFYAHCFTVARIDSSSEPFDLFINVCYPFNNPPSGIDWLS